ncbi:MAG: tetratricopeptide repeat protein [Anaerolineales bacterium]|nr:tetratricopeptide repeat protein [Anaerolineales bacterium]
MNDEPAAEEEVAESSASPERRSQSLGWRSILAILSLVIVGILAYQFFEEQNRAGPATPANVSPPVPTQVTAPEATAQANPNSAQAQFELGNAYTDAGQWEQAQAAFQKAIELDPNFQSAYANLGVVYYQLGQLDLSASQYQKALELDPTDGDVAYNLGALYLQQALLKGNPPDPDSVKQAVDQLQQAIELDPDLAEPYFSLGVAYKALNQKTEAIQAFETFLARNSNQDPRASQEAQRYLDTLRSQ